MAGLFKKRILNNNEEIASNSNAQRKAYTNEDVLKALGVNEKFLTNEETINVLVRMLETVENFDIKQIQTPEQFNEVLTACKKQIEVSKDGKKVFGMTNKEDNKCEVQQMELGRGNRIKRKRTELNITKDEQKNMTITEIIQRYGEMEMKKGADDIQVNILRSKQLKSPGISNSPKNITMQMMKEAQDTEVWDDERNQQIGRY